MTTNKKKKPHRMCETRVMRLVIIISIQKNWKIYDKNQCDVLKIFYREKKILVKVEEISPRVQKQKRAWLQDPPTIMHI